VEVIVLKPSTTSVYADQLLTRLLTRGFFLRIARRDTAKRRYEQKNEDKNNAIRQRASEFKEKEKVRVTHGSIAVFPLNRNVHMLHRLLWICSNSWQSSDSDNNHVFTCGARTSRHISA
jgi:hypothetical protein